MTGRHPQNMTGHLDLEISPTVVFNGYHLGIIYHLGMYHAWLKGDTTAIKDHRKLAGNSSDPNIPKLQYQCNIYIKKMVSEIILNRDPKNEKLYHHSHCFNGHKIGEKTPFSENTMSWCFRLRPGTDVGTLLHRSTGIGIWWKRELQQKSLRKNWGFHQK